MKRWAIVAFLALGGCSLNQDFVRGVDGYSSVILPEYEEYVKQDPRLDANSKRIRLQTSERFQKLIEEARDAQR
jgi:hypothetical protein